MRLQSFRIRMFVGPTSVEHYADRARAIGMADVLAGTEHIHFTTGPLAVPENETDRLVMRQRIGESIYGEPGFAAVWREVEILRAV